MPPFTSEKGGYRLRRPNGRPWRDRLPGGLADHLTPSDFDPVALAQGRRVEVEHTTDRDLATEIAMDHLVEDPAYYQKLARMERRNPASGHRPATSSRRPTVIVIAAAPGFIRAARGLVSRALREVLHIKAWDTPPYNVQYWREGYEGDPNATARYTLDMTLEELIAVYEVIERMAKAEGWSAPPVYTHQWT